MAEETKSSTELRQLAFLGTYVPRRCGIATFTSDVCEAVSAEAPDSRCFAVAMNDKLEGYAYPNRVRFEIDAGQREHYDRAADFLNVNQVDVVSLQHEYGIFGGANGRYVLHLLRQLRTPIVTTLHTVLQEPSPQQHQILSEICDIADRVVVMSPRAQQYLRDIYKIPAAKVCVIHHGIPDMPFVDPNYYKDHFGAAGRRMMLTFGLLNPGKGIEYVIEALPRVVAQFPDLLYIVLGVTHPHIRREHGEEYRMRLQQRVRELGLDPNVEFRNRFVEISELCEYLGAADLYATPYLNPAQIVSGTLAYAMGTGKAVVSTPYCYAEDMLADGRGRLVPFRDPQAMADVLIDLLTNEVERHAMRKRAYEFGRSMIWKQVAQEYLAVFREVRAERRRAPRPLTVSKLRVERFEELPEFSPRHLLTLTDTVGVLQHARYTIPDPQHGYSTDDQARALMVASKALQHFPEAADWDQLASRYLSFLLYAFDAETRRFSNFMNYQRAWIRPLATDDVHGRAVLALAHVVAYSGNEGHRSLAMQLLDQAIPPTTSFTSPRAWATAILAIQLYLQRYSGASSFRRERRQLAYQIFEQFQRNASHDWPWLEDQLTYTNAGIPQALIEVAQWLPDHALLECGLRALRWLDAIQTSEKGHFVPIGNHGWYTRGGVRARFDQQPVEAYTMLDACVTAYRVTRDEHWVAAARRAFDWFLGRNDLLTPVYNYSTHGCFDGLHSDRVNQNQGAESTIAWLLSLLLMRELQDEINQKNAEAQKEVAVP